MMEVMVMESDIGGSTFVSGVGELPVAEIGLLGS